MIELISAEQLGKAIERARRSNLFVKTTSFRRMYRVLNRENGNEYVVNFYVRNGKRYGHCSCLAGVNHQICKHIAAAASAHVGICAMRCGKSR